MQFIQRIQHRLLLNYPQIWNSRIIPVLLLAGGMDVLLFLIFYFMPSPTPGSGTLVPWVSFLSLSAMIGVVVYLIFLLRFNYFKNFGLLRPMDFFFQFLLLFVALGTFVSWPFIPSLAVHVSVSSRYDMTQLEKDLGEAYILAAQLEYTQATAPYRKIRVEITDSVEGGEEDYVNNTLYVRSEEDIDRTRFVKMEKAGDKAYIGYETVSFLCGEYPYSLADMEKLNARIYASLPAVAPDKAVLEKKLGGIFSAYLPGTSIYCNSMEDYNSCSVSGEESAICNRYRLNELGWYMNRIDHDVFDSGDWQFFCRMWFYTTLYASLLLLIFRYMTPRTFLWTLLFTFLLFVFTVIFSIFAFSGPGGLLGTLLSYYLLFTGFAVSIFFSRSRNVFQGIALNLSFFCLNLFPVFIVWLYYSMVGYDYHTEEQAAAMSVAEKVGLLLVLLSSLFLHSRLFYKWYSLPEE